MTPVRADNRTLVKTLSGGAGIFFLAALPALAAERLDLPAALNRALSNNLALARQARAVAGAREAQKAAEAEFAFRLAPFATVERDNDGDRYEYGVTLGRKFLTGAEASAGPVVRWTEAADNDPRTVWRIDLRQPLFRQFGALAQGEPLAQARSRSLAARRDLQRQKADLALRVVELYESVLRLERQVAADEAALARLEKLHRLTRVRERQGRATRVDVLRVDLQRGEAKVRLENARERLATLRREFAEALGAPPDAVFELETPPLLDVEIPSVEQAVALALSNRLDYAQVLQDLKDARRAERLARRDLQPDVALIARVERDRDADAGGEETRWILGLSGQTDLRQAGDRARLRQAELVAASARDTIEILERSIAREILQVIGAYRRARQELDIAERNYRLAERRARLARRLFEVGRGDNFSVTDAEEALTRAEERRYAARAEASVAGYRFLHAAGILLESPPDLRPGAGATVP